MKNYVVYFELFGRRMQTTVLANNEIHAKELVTAKLKFHKVEIKKDDSFNEAIDMIDVFTKGFKR